MREKATFPHSGNAFPRVIQKYTNSQTLQDYIFHILQYFATKLHNFSKFRKFFPTVPKLFSNLKLCLIGEWSIDGKYIFGSCVFIGIYACVMIITQSTTVLITCGQFVN